MWCYLKHSWFILIIHVWFIFPSFHPFESWLISSSHCYANQINPFCSADHTVPQGTNTNAPRCWFKFVTLYSQKTWPIFKQFWFYTFFLIHFFYKFMLAFYFPFYFNREGGYEEDGLVFSKSLLIHLFFLKYLQL